MGSRTPGPKSPPGARPKKARAGARDRDAAPRDAGSGERRKTTRLEARVTDAQKALLQQAAELRGQTLTEFVVRAGEDAAMRVLERAGVYVVPAPDSAAFVEALLDPPAPPARLRAAAERYRASRAMGDDGRTGTGGE